MNIVFLTGNLTQDPVLRSTTTGIDVCRFRIAVDRRKTNGNETDFFDIVAWRQLGVTFSQYLSKGRKVGVKGRIRTGTREKEDVKISKFEIEADEVEFLNSPNAGSAYDAG